jgi:hypothetical protein
MHSGRFLQIIYNVLNCQLYLIIDMQVIMFLSKSDEETTSNRKLAKELVDKWVISCFF